MTAMVVLVGCGSAQQAKEITNVGTWTDYTLELLDADVDEANNMIKVKATFTNASAEPNYALSGFAVRAFQNDTELTEAWERFDDHNLTTEVKDGQSISVIYYFELADNSEVEVLIGEPTADQTTVGKKSYSIGE